MGMTFQLKRPRGQLLGSSDDVIERLSNAFPDFQFRLVEEEPPGEIEILQSAPFYMRLVQSLFFPRSIGFPQYRGASSDFSTEFTFEASDQVRRVIIRCWGSRKDRDALFEKFFDETGWIPAPW